MSPSTSLRSLKSDDDYFWNADYPTSAILNDVAFGLYFISIFLYLLFVCPRVFMRRAFREGNPMSKEELIAGLSSAALFIFASILSITSIALNGGLSDAWMVIPIIIIILCLIPLVRYSLEYHDYETYVKQHTEEEQVFVVRREDVVVVGNDRDSHKL